MKIRKSYLKIISWTKEEIDDGDTHRFNDKIRIGMQVKNIKNKDIDAFSGRILIYDKLGNEIARLGVKSTSVLKKKNKSTLHWVFGVGFNDEMEEVYRSPASSLKFSFEPGKILLKNGKEL